MVYPAVIIVWFMVSQHDFMYRKAIIMLYATVFFLYNLLYFGFFDVYGHVYCL